MNLDNYITPPKHCVVIGAGLSGLASAYFLQRFAAAAGLALKVTVVEGTSRIGGKIWSTQEEGFLCERGPNGFINHNSETLSLCQELGLHDQLVNSNPTSQKRFIYADGSLHGVPMGLSDFLKSDLLSFGGKFRLAAEFFVPKSIGGDESLATFAMRRLGKEALDKLITPMASGVFAGDPATMSFQASFPRIHALEQNQRSLILAYLKARWGKANLKGAPVGNDGGVTSLLNGIQTLTDALAVAVGTSNIVCNQAITGVKFHENKFIVSGQDFEVSTDMVVCATEAPSAAQIFHNFDFQLSALLSQIKYAPLAVVCHGFAPGVLEQELSGFGYLLSAQEALPILGTLWDSSIFPNRAPAGGALLRTMVGGARFPDLIECNDAELLSLVKQSLFTIVGIKAQASLEKVYRYSKAIPRYDLGHNALVAAIEAQAATYGKLFFLGNAFHGVAINDCVRNAKAAATKIINLISCA